MRDPNAEKRARTLVLNAEAKFLGAEMLEHAATEALFAEAKDMLMEAERNVPGSGSWLLACISAWQEQGALCQKWLERGLKYKTLPSKDEVFASPYMMKIQHHQWYKTFAKKWR